MKKKLLLATTCFLSATALAEDINTLPKDTTKVIDIEEVVVIASPKETGKLRELPNAVSLILFPPECGLHDCWKSNRM